MKNAKKIFTVVLATAMAMSTTVVTGAADATAAPATGEAVGTGDIEGFVNKDVFTVTLPTITDVTFKIDPQELLKASGNTDTLDGTAFSSVSDGYGKKVLFKKAANTWVSASEGIKVINKSTFDVDVTVNAKLTGLSVDSPTTGYAIDVVDTVNEASGAATQISMKVTPTIGVDTNGVESAANAITSEALTADSEGITFTTKVSKAANYEDAYKITGSNKADYAYVLDSTAAQGVGFNFVSYSLSGAVNTLGDWTNFSKDTNSALKATVSWTIDKHSDYTPVKILLVSGSLWSCAGVNDSDVWPTNTVIENLKVNGVSCEYTLNAGYVEMTKAQLTAAGGDALGIANPDGSYTYAVSYTVNGTDYAGTYVYTP